MQSHRWEGHIWSHTNKLHFYRVHSDTHVRVDKHDWLARLGEGESYQAARRMPCEPFGLTGLAF